ncbi:hypothetical protein TREMEDRAFT_69280 [Tremella mesenterica DSM 1558]|uniref:uncharacterized protein n=1 Tax=Tremella mesenterica (strain ATCC 24925 / CBS 8224 / DSM 1558 / NBRC 9311 / NRRL Y-6157 / RJB 2259-6 / UBC 559-6) TaxID=578456 RepID=UPI0003F49F25|nr:uncharacterized protein TREMEDRAFT_69280 [Tremella mesenterica DSM 1558]EIW68265.1 hypothetical protein TREMEDRAFT_69280 [Tremella mesenterica DSM 1558]
MFSARRAELSHVASGPRYTDFVTQFPSPFTAAASFDRDLIEERAIRIGGEFVGKGINVELGPITGGPLGRSPFAGRNWEGFSPDPYLSSTMSFLTVRGMQSSGLITCAKHYFLYEQEPVCTGPVVDGGRTDCHDVSSEVDDKTVHELYLPSFAEAVRAGTGSLTDRSYNRINGTASCQSDDSMNRLLKDELNFQGFDFGAAHSTVPSALAGMDMELPGEYFYGRRLYDAVLLGEVPMSRLDDMAQRILTPYFAQGQYREYPAVNYQKYNLRDSVEVHGMTFRNLHINNKGDNHLLARKIAAESTVMLKNSGVLPLNGVKRIGIFGTDADYPATMSGCGPDLFCGVASDRWYWNGTVTIGGGSGAAYADYIAAPLEAISLRARREGARVDYVLQDDPAHFGAMSWIASQSEVCLVFVSLFLVESWDRENLRLDKGGEELIKHVEGSCAGEVVVVLHIGGQVVMEDWLPFTIGRMASDWPTGNIVRDMSQSTKDIPHSPPNGKRETYPRSVFSEGTAIDYKWFDKWSIEPRFEFGFGMSYTSFELSYLSLSEEYRPQSDTIQNTNERYEGSADLYDILYVARVKVTNIGKVAGAAVPQLYMSFPSSEPDQPPNHLRGFAKPSLIPGQATVVEFPLRKKDLSVWDVERQLWRIPHGVFTFRVGQSSRDLPLVLESRIKSR